MGAPPAQPEKMGYPDFHNMDFSYLGIDPLYKMEFLLIWGEVPKKIRPPHCPTAATASSIARDSCALLLEQRGLMGPAVLDIVKKLQLPRLETETYAVPMCFRLPSKQNPAVVGMWRITWLCADIIKKSYAPPSNIHHKNPPLVRLNIVHPVSITYALAQNDVWWIPMLFGTY